MCSGRKRASEENNMPRPARRTLRNPNFQLKPVAAAVAAALAGPGWTAQDVATVGHGAAEAGCRSRRFWRAWSRHALALLPRCGPTELATVVHTLGLRG